MNVLDGQERTKLRSITPIVPVREMARSVAFYERMGFVARLYPDGKYAFLERDALELHLNVMEAAEWTSNPTGVYFHVDDVDVLYEEFRAAGVVCLHEPEDRPWQMREFAVSDPDEALLRFGQRAVGTVGV